MHMKEYKYVRENVLLWKALAYITIDSPVVWYVEVKWENIFDFIYILYKLWYEKEVCPLIITSMPVLFFFPCLFWLISRSF